MKVLVAVDGSKYSAAAVDSICQRQWPVGSEFMVLAVAEHMITVLDNMLVPYEREAFQDIKKQCEQFVATSEALIKQKLNTSAVVGVVTEGNAADQIVRQAKEWAADFVIMGSHGRSGLEKFLLGSVTEAVVSRSPCSVEVIKMVRVKHPEHTKQLSSATRAGD